jgi:hypothetical protein
MAREGHSRKWPVTSCPISRILPCVGNVWNAAEAMAKVPQEKGKFWQWPYRSDGPQVSQ